jgi:ketosteroid isomerase-like protein
MTDAEAGIREVLERYEAALNASDTATVMTLYAEGGVFMPPFSGDRTGGRVRGAGDRGDGARLGVRAHQLEWTRPRTCHG